MPEENLRETLLSIVESVGRNDIPVKESVCPIKAILSKKLDFSTPKPIWRWGYEVEGVLIELMPEKESVFKSPGDQPMGATEETINPETARVYVARSIMRGLELFHSNESVRDGAKLFLNSCPSLIRKSTTPFADSKGQWDHNYTADE